MRAIGRQPYGRLNLVENVVDCEAMALHTYSVDAGIWADASGHLHEGLAHVYFLIVDNFGAERLGQLEAVWVVIDGNDAVSAKHEGALNSEQPHRAAAPHRNDVSWLDVAVNGSHPAGG